MIGWLLRLFGLARPDRPAPADGRPVAPRQPAKPALPPVEVLTPEQFREARRRVVGYVARSRVPLRQVVAARQKWLVDLSKVYEAIKDSPTALVLERAGAVGENHEPVFRDALSFAQSLEPPPEAEALHAALVGWITALHSACLALIDARKLRDRAMLGQLREQLGQARKHAAVLVGERTRLFAEYKLNVQPAVQRSKRQPAPAERAPEPPARPRRGQRPVQPTPAASPTGRRPSSRARRTRRPGQPPRRERTQAEG